MTAQAVPGWVGNPEGIQKRRYEKSVGEHVFSRAQRRPEATSARLCALLKSFPSRYPHIHPMEDLCLGLFARSTFASSGIFLLFPLFVQAQALSFSIGTASAAPGQKSTGYLEVPAGVDAATNIPVIIINGEKRGPVLALVSGAHGTEYTSIIALEKLINLLDPSQIAGTVILVPLVNIQSNSNKRSPMLTPSITRAHEPASTLGRPMERKLNARPFLSPNKSSIDVIILSTTTAAISTRAFRPYAYWAPTGKETQDQISKEMVLAFGLDHIIIWRDRPTDLQPPLATSTTPLLLAANLPSLSKLATPAPSKPMTSLPPPRRRDIQHHARSPARCFRRGPVRPIEKPVWLDRVVDVLSDGPWHLVPACEAWYLRSRGNENRLCSPTTSANLYSKPALPSPASSCTSTRSHLSKKGDNIADIATLAAHRPLI